MSYNGSGTFVINTAGQPVVANTVISATVFNALTADLATGLSTAITKDGQTTITANIPFGSNKITGLGSGTAATDAANLGQVQSTAAKLVTVTGTDTLTGTMSPALTAYATGQLFYFIAGAANTGAMTINIDGLGAKSITRDGATALIANDVLSGEIVVICYDGTRFQMINAANSFGNTTINGTLTVTGNAGFQANVSITSALSVGGVFAVTGASTLTGTATLTANPVLNGGTANGVLYLNGSKVATSGSALTFDGSTLTNTGNNTGTVFNTIVNTDAAGSSITDERIIFAMGGSLGSGVTGWANAGIVEAASTGGLYLGAFNGPINFATGSSARNINMVLTAAGNLGIGTTSPGARLHSVDTIHPAYFAASGTSLYTTYSRSNTTVVGYIGNGTGLIGGSNNDNFAIRAESALMFASGGATERMRLDSSGNLGLGVTPSAWGTGSSIRALQLNSGALWNFSTSGLNLIQNGYYDGSNYKYVATAAASQYSQSAGAHSWYTAASGTAGNNITFTQAMTLDASGKLGIGTTSPTAILEVNASGGGTFRVTRSSVSSAYLQLSHDGTNGTVEASGANSLLFSTNGSERARIDSSGNLLVGATATVANAKFYVNGSVNNDLVSFYNSNASPYGVQVYYSGAAPNGTVNGFLECYDTGGQRATIRSNGGLANYQGNDVNLSDERVKTDIKPVGSYWNKIKAIEIVTFKYKDQTHDDDNVGVIAQQVESVAPEFVDVDGFGKTPENGVPLKTIYTTDMYHAAIKALQEAMARIEQLEAKVAALESK